MKNLLMPLLKDTDLLHLLTHTPEPQDTPTHRPTKVRQARPPRLRILTHQPPQQPQQANPQTTNKCSSTYQIPSPLSNKCSNTHYNNKELARVQPKPVHLLPKLRAQLKTPINKQVMAMATLLIKEAPIDISFQCTKMFCRKIRTETAVGNSIAGQWV